MSTSYDPNTRFSSLWEEATDDFASALGHRLARKSGRPTGIIHMTGEDVPLASWIPFDGLKNAPSLKADYENLAQVQPGNAIYDANVRRYIAAWKSYWSDFIPPLIATRAVPNGEPWGTYPQLAAEVTSKATQTQNVCAASFIPGSFKGIVFLPGPATVKDDQGANFGPEMSALANSFITGSGGKARFIHGMPDRQLAPKVTAPAAIQGEHRSIAITGWADPGVLLDAIAAAAE